MYYKIDAKCVSTHYRLFIILFYKKKWLVNNKTFIKILNIFIDTIPLLKITIFMNIIITKLIYNFI